MSTVRADEGRRVLRNVASIGAFLMAPLQLMLMVRALGADGYGRWWWTFVLLEAAGMLGMVGADLFVRREVSALPNDDAGTTELVEVVGSALLVACVAGTGFALLQIGLAPRLAAAQGDSELLPFMVILAFQPLLWNIGGVLGAALQSRDFLGTLAILRGIVFPLIVAGVYYASWQLGLPIRTTLSLMLGVSIVGAVTVAMLYARHFPLLRTLRAAVRPRRVRPALRYGLRLFVPLVIFTIGGKIDLYFLGAYVAPIQVGIYAACLQMASGVPNSRGLFDPVIQTQVGALYHHHREQLGRSLRHLARLCAFGLAPAFVVTIAVGEPILGWLLGQRVPAAVVPLTILTVGNFVGCVAVAAWLVPMMLAGRALTFIATVALVVKLALLWLLVPRHGAIGAAIATAVGFAIAHHAQSAFGARVAGFRPFPASMLPVMVVALVVAAAGRALFVTLEAQVTQVQAVMIAGPATLAVLALALSFLLDAADRLELRKLLGMRTPVTVTE